MRPRCRGKLPSIGSCDSENSFQVDTISPAIVAVAVVVVESKGVTGSLIIASTIQRGASATGVPGPRIQRYSPVSGW